MINAVRLLFSRAVRWLLLAGFYAVSTAIWLVVFAAALEGFERGRSYIAEVRYKTYYDQQNRKVYRRVSQEELLKAHTRFAPPNRENVFASASSTLVAPVAEDLEKARTTYAAQSEENLNVILTLRDDLLLEFDRKGRLLASHGEPVLENMFVAALGSEPPVAPFPKWPEAFAAVTTATSPVTIDCELQKTEMAGMPFLYRITVTPLAASDGSIDRVQVLFHDVSPPITPERLVDNFPSGGDETPWAISNYMYKKNWKRENAFFSYNNLGFRDNDIVVPKPAGVIRIVCIGGSTTEEGNSNEETYPHVLQTKLRTWLGTDRIEVVNCGICGMVSSGERMRMPDFLALQPDLILRYNAINDFYRCDFPIWFKEAGKMREKLSKSKFMARHFNRWFLPSDEYLTGYFRATQLRNIKAIKYAAGERGVDLACCSFAFPTISSWDFRNRNYLDMNMRYGWYAEMVNFDTYCKVMSLYNRLLKETCAQEGIVYVPVAENMNAGMDHFLDVCHVTPAGMELKTNIIGAYVRDYVQRRLADTVPQPSQ